MSVSRQPDSPQSVSPFHEGEQRVQAHLGVRETMERWGSKVIRAWMPDQHRAFYAQLPFVVAAARDDRGRPWVTLLTGEPGFAQSPDPKTFVVHSDLLPGDPLEGSLRPGEPLGVLGIELETRRRNRVNGIVADAGPGCMTLDVEHAFGNCPQYIHPRTVRTVEVPTAHMTMERRADLTDPMQSWIAQADTFFIGSGHPAGEHGNDRSMDASHRGGPPGFVHVAGRTRLLFPDYAGNNHFNTIGNLVLDPRVALLFVDFESGGVLQITGRASIDWDSPAVARHPGAQRLVIVDIDEIIERKNVLPLEFSAPKGLVRELRVVDKRKESTDVTSFYLVPRDDGELPEFEAGQHLPLEFQVEDGSKPISRTYSLSNAPGQGVFRISVKRQSHGRVSRVLHDSVEIGSIINGFPPAGDFVIDDRDRPVLLISAGIGVTPMISMLNDLTREPSNRPIIFLHGARDGHHHPFAEEVALIDRNNANVIAKVAYSHPRPEDVMGRDYDVVGHIDKNLVRDTVTDLAADVFVCGPAAFMAAITDILSEIGIADERVHVEEF